MTVHFVYIVRCADGSLYTGYARDPRARLRLHNSGRGAKYTSGRRPVRLVYSEACGTLSDALKREYELKQWPRAKKQLLIISRRRQSNGIRGRVRVGSPEEKHGGLPPDGSRRGKNLV